jgi:hypothetical protein
VSPRRNHNIGRGIPFDFMQQTAFLLLERTIQRQQAYQLEFQILPVEWIAISIQLSQPIGIRSVE